MTEQEMLKNQYRTLFSSDKGKIVLADLEKVCGYNSPSFDERMPDINKTIYQEGKRRVYLRILNMMEK